MAKKVKESTEVLKIENNQGEVLAEYPPKLLNVIKSTVAKNATDEELYMFLQVASMYDLNPFLKEIWFIKNKDGSIIITTSRDGYRKICSRDPDFKDCRAFPVHQNDEFEMELTMGEIMNIHHKFKQNDRGKLIGAYSILFTHTGDKIAHYVDYDEYNQGSPVWRKYPSAMICKVAENYLMKRFANIDGIQTVEDAPKEVQVASEFIDVNIGE